MAVQCGCHVSSSVSHDTVPLKYQFSELGRHQRSSFRIRIFNSHIKCIYIGFQNGEDNRFSIFKMLTLNHGFFLKVIELRIYTTERINKIGRIKQV